MDEAVAHKTDRERYGFPDNASDHGNTRAAASSSMSAVCSSELSLLHGTVQVQVVVMQCVAMHMQ